VLKYEDAKRVEEVAFDKGLFVGIEYHKRFDRRSLIARRSYEMGSFGEFVMGEAKMIGEEPAESGYVCIGEGCPEEYKKK